MIFKIITEDDLSEVLNIPLGRLKEIARDINKHYRFTKIRTGKKNKLRDTFIAKPELRRIHDSININILDKIDFPIEIRGGVRGRSVSSNASVHQNKINIACFDIKDFYPSTPPAKVFRSFTSIGISPKPARLLTRLVTLDSLPIGFATSPKLSALVLIKLSRRIKNFVKKFNVEHSIWIDDLTLSGNYPLKKLRSGIKTIVKDEGYRLNEEKTEFRYRRQPQFVNSINVNGELTATKERVERVKLAIHISKKYGIKSYINKHEPGTTVDELKRKMAGRLGNLMSINRSKYEKLKKEWKDVVKASI